MGDSNLNLELIKISKDMLVDQYIDKKTQNHNKWIVESEYWWKLNKTILEYPQFPPYPTEKEIIERAKIFKEFVKVEPENTNITTLEIAPIESEQEIKLSPTTSKDESKPSNSPFLGFLYRFRRQPQ